MKYFIDTADQDEINSFQKFVCGVTSNPSLLMKSGIDTYKFYIENESLFNNIFIQVNSMQDIQYLIDKGVYTRKKIIFKVPLVVTSDFNGYKLLNRINELGNRTCATIVYNIGQFDYACEAGVEYSIVLYAKNDNKTLMKECCDLKQLKGYKTKIIAASFRSPEHVFDCIKCGVEYATVPPSVMKQIISNEKAIVDYNNFYME